MQGMQQLAKERPQNPISWLGKFLLDHDETKSENPDQEEKPNENNQETSEKAEEAKPQASAPVAEVAV